MLSSALTKLGLVKRQPIKCNGKLNYANTSNISASSLTLKLAVPRDVDTLPRHYLVTLAQIMFIVAHSKIYKKCEKMK